MYCTRGVLSPQSIWDVALSRRNFIIVIRCHPGMGGGAKESVVKVDERPQLELIIYLPVGCLVA